MQQPLLSILQPDQDIKEPEDVVICEAGLYNPAVRNQVQKV